MPKQITGDEPIAPKDSYQYHNEDGTITIVNKWDGLTIRQNFAARAMQGFCAASNDDTISTKTIFEILGLPSETKYEYPKHYFMYLSKISVYASDMLIAELNKQL